MTTDYWAKAEQQYVRWGSVRSRGLLHFILVRGALRMVLVIGTMIAMSSILGEPTIFQMPALKWVPVLVIVWIGGSLGAWYLEERRYRRYQSQRSL